MSTAILTGATGFLGGHLLRRLLADGWDVFATKRESSIVPLGMQNAHKLHWANAECPSSVADLFELAGKVDAVFHLATSYGRDEDSATSIVQSNVLMPLSLLEQSIANGVEVFLYTDTCFTVDYPYLQTYTLSKKQFADWGRILSESSSLRFVNLELQHPFGPGDRAGKFVPWIIEQCLQEGKPITLTSGEQRKDFIFVADVIDAIMIVVEQTELLKSGYSKFECGRGETIEIRKFVELVHTVCKSKRELDFGALPYRQSEIMVSEADIQGLRRLNWAPTWSVENGIAATVAEFQRLREMCNS